MEGSFYFVCCSVYSPRKQDDYFGQIFWGKNLTTSTHRWKLGELVTDPILAAQTFMSINLIFVMFDESWLMF